MKMGLTDWPGKNRQIHLDGPMWTCPKMNSIFALEKCKYNMILFFRQPWNLYKLGGGGWGGDAGLEWIWKKKREKLVPTYQLYFISLAEPKAHRWAHSIIRHLLSIGGVHQHFQTTSSLKPWSQFLPNFTYSIYRKGERIIVFVYPNQIRIWYSYTRGLLWQLTVAIDL